MKRYNKIVGVFAKTINKLESLNAQCGQRIADINNNINSLENEREGQALEGKAANNTAKRLKELIGPEPLQRKITRP